MMMKFDIYGYPYVIDDSRDQDLLTRHNPPLSKEEYPYGYDPFTIWGEARAHKECNGSVYTDTLFRDDCDKYERLALKHYGHGGFEGDTVFSSYACKGPLIEAFLRDWFDDPELKLLRVIEYCNKSNGFHTWRLDFVQKKVA
jgi:hypothetical protein